MTSTIALNEILYTTVNIVGLVVSLRNIRLYWGDVQFLRKHRRNGARLALAWDTFRNEFGRTLTTFGLMLIGIYALFAPPPNNPVGAWLGTIVFMTAAFYSTISSILTAQAREVVVKDLEEQRRIKMQNIRRERDIAREEEA